jgi:hypothetical protein
VRLHALQTQLETLYDVAAGHAVDDFLIHDPLLVRRLEADPAARDVPEKLLVCQHGEELDLALYLEAAVLERLAQDDPLTRLHGGNLEDFLTVLEGVSHFLYLTWNARHARPVSLLELELQAEVDKYVVAAALLGRQHGRRPDYLHHLLFDAAVFDASLSAVARARYHRANHAARRYCAWLCRRFPDTRSPQALSSELRRFYRLTQHDKLHRIPH